MLNKSRGRRRDFNPLNYSVVYTQHFIIIIATISAFIAYFRFIRHNGASFGLGGAL